MGARTVEVRYARNEGAASEADAQLHEHVLASVMGWLELQLHAKGHWVEEYYSEAKRSSGANDLWGPSKNSLVYVFPDFAGLHHLGASAFSHWFELAIAVLHPYLQVRASELGLRLLDRPIGADRIASTPSDSPLIQLGDQTYWLEWAGQGAPPPNEQILFSRDDLPRRSLASLAPDERTNVDRLLLHRLCQCDLCAFVRPSVWGGRDPYGGTFDFGMKEGAALLSAGNFTAARSELTRGAMLGAPWEGWQYAVWMASTFASDRGSLSARKHAFQWVMRALDQGMADPRQLGSDDDLESLRGPELDAMIARGRRIPLALPRGDVTLLTRASERLSGDLSGLARVAGTELRGNGRGGFPHPLPASFRLLVEQLRLKDAVAPIDMVAGLCMRLSSTDGGGSFVELSEHLELAMDPELSFSVCEASIVYPRPEAQRSTVELRVWGDRRVTEYDASTGVETQVGLLTRLELTRLVCDAYDARFGELQIPLTSRFASISPTGRPPPASRVTVFFPNEAPVWCEAGIGDSRSGATFFALQHHLDGLATWARHRALHVENRAEQTPARFPRWTIAERRARTLRQLELAAQGDPSALEIGWHGPATETEVVWFVLDEKAIFRRASMTEPPYQATKRLGTVSPAEVVRVAKALLALGFPSCGLPTATLNPVERPRAGSIGLEIATTHDLAIQVELPETALLDHPPLAALFERLQALVNETPRRDPSRRELVLPAFPKTRGAIKSGSYDKPWTLPLHLVVLADLRGERASVPLADVPLLRASSETVDALRTRLLAGKPPVQVPVWQAIEALCATAHASGADTLIELLDVGLLDLRDDFDDAADLGKSGLYRHLVAGTLDSFGARPIDAVLLAFELQPRDVPYLHKLETLLENGPMHAFGRLPEGAAQSRHRLVDAEPFDAARALIQAFANDPLCREIEGLTDAQTASFAVARVARHLSPLQLARGPKDCSFGRAERRARTWLFSQQGFARPLNSYTLTEEDDQMSSTAISYTLRVKFDRGFEGSVPFLLRLGGTIGSDPGEDQLVAEAVVAPTRGGVRSHRVVCGGATAPGSGRWLRVSDVGLVSMVELTAGASVETDFGPASGESLGRLDEALAGWVESDEFRELPDGSPVPSLVLAIAKASAARAHRMPGTAWSPVYGRVMKRLREVVLSTVGFDLRLRALLEAWQEQLAFSSPSNTAAALECVLAFPQDDGARLVLANLLVRAGDPRGDFILTQLTLAKLQREQAVYPDIAPFAMRSHALLEAHRATWTLPVSGLTERPSFRRGMIDGVAMTPLAFVARAGELFRVAPILHLDVIGAEGIEELFASPHFARLLSLNLFDQRIGDRGARALAASPHARSLAWLDLAYNQLTSEGLEALLASPNLPRLAWINLVSNGFEDPCDQLGGVEGDTIHSFSTPSNQAELERRFGPKRWLHWRPSLPQYFRPDPVMFSSSQPYE